MKEVSYQMSNFDYKIDDGMAEVLMNNPNKVFGRHTAWNFNGRVYFKDQNFYEDVRIHRQFIETLSAPSLEALMKKANDKYGWM